MASTNMALQEALVAGTLGITIWFATQKYRLPRGPNAVQGSVGGNDFAGEVVEVGVGVKRFKKGDRILAFTFGLNPTDSTSGAFGQYALATEDVACTIPHDMSYEEASTLGVAIGTAGTALFQALQLPLPTEHEPARKPFHVLVSGGASSTGAMAIQMIKCAGLIPIATCSPINADLVKSRGAEQVFDYHSLMRMCYGAIGSSGGRYVAIDPFTTRIQYSRRDVQADWLMIYSLLGDPVKLAGVYGRPACPQDREFASRLFPVAETLLSQGFLKPHPMEIRTGGLNTVAYGIDDLRAGRVRAKKLVYPMMGSVYGAHMLTAIS